MSDLVGNPEDRFSQNEAHMMFLIVVNFFDFYFVISTNDLVHNVEALHGLCLLLTASGNLFRNMSDALEKISRCC